MVIVNVARVRRFHHCHKVLVRSGVPRGFAWSVIIDALNGKERAILWIKLAFMCRHLEPAKEWR